MEVARSPFRAGIIAMVLIIEKGIPTDILSFLYTY